jgi:hypothetical protein
VLVICDIAYITSTTPGVQLAKKESSQKIQIVADMARISCGAFVGTLISDVGDRGTPGYWLERQGSFRYKIIDMLWILEIFSSVISFG